MPITASDFMEMVSLIEQHPEWRAELRRLVLTEDLLALPRIVVELGEAQKRTEQGILELVKAQQDTEHRITRLEKAVNRLDDRFGVTEEEEAADVLRVVLERKGFRILGESFNLRFNGEVDVVLPVADSEGRHMSALVEAKVRLAGRAVDSWASRVRSHGFQSELQSAGIPGPYLVYAYGMRIDLSARTAAEKNGIGLLTGRGEEIEPRPF